MSAFVDMRLLERGLRELVPGGPALGPDEAAGVVEELRAAAETSVDLVLDVMRLEPEHADAVRARAAHDHVLVVDRPGWAKATAQSLSAMLGPVVSPATRAAMEDSRLSTTMELAGVLALLSTRVLGQFDPFGAGAAGGASTPSAGASGGDASGVGSMADSAVGTAAGRLLLVAPTVAQTEASLGVPARDFRLWVALHETTHRMQFAAAPWLRGHLQVQVAELLDEQKPEEGPGRGARSRPGVQLGLGEVLSRLPQVVRGEAELVDMLTQPAQREALDRVLAVMSLLEGHADVVMDAVGTGVIPSLRLIRKRFEARRDAGIGPAGTIGRLLGADSKLRQYREGAAFVRAVVRRAGHAGLAAVFADPENLPSPEEIARPRLWVERVNGT
ncbi:zinc-dependent metalloprotease [Brevibacterium album]|uniref:zinc-dependent metalloprotease n=1 Tax=Brevibacterium album TaxID=417948 RepID=UPI000A06ED84|nr:zinc-dependent metalloprotease [Brevibacterium album]